MLITKQFEIENRDIVRQALCDYRNGRGDIADYLIGRTNRSHGCDFTATFDRSLKDSPFCLSRAVLLSQMSVVKSTSHDPLEGVRSADRKKLKVKPATKKIERRKHCRSEI